MGNSSETKDANKTLHISASNLSLQELVYRLRCIVKKADSLSPHSMHGYDIDFDKFMRTAREHAEKFGSMVDLLTGKTISLPDGIPSGFKDDLSRICEIHKHLNDFLQAMEPLGEPAEEWVKSWFSGERKEELLKAATEYNQNSPE